MIKQRLIPVARSYAMVVVPVALLIAASAGAAPSRATTSLVKPRTLVIEHGRIHKFAQDGDLITWVGGRHYVVHLRGVSSARRSWVLGNAGPGGAVGAQSASTLVLGGKTAVWVKYAGVMTREAGIYASKPGQKKPKLVDAPGVSESGGTYLTGLAASGGTIVYGDAQMRRPVGRRMVAHRRRSASLRRKVVPTSNPWHPAGVCDRDRGPPGRRRSGSGAGPAA